jgi:hypothetical protein
LKILTVSSLSFIRVTEATGGWLCRLNEQNPINADDDLLAQLIA